MSDTLLPTETLPPNAGESPAGSDLHDITFLGDVEVTVSVELGRTSMPVREVLKLRRGSVIELNKLSGQPVEVLVNNTLMARGEVILINGRFGIRLNAFVAKEGA
jgi:flagellar motor switch protein FliN/FliY